MTPRHASPRAIVLFDGVCNVCNGVVQFLLKRDAPGHIHYASLQSAAGKALLTAHGLLDDKSTDEVLSTMVLVTDGKAYTRSDAVLKTASYLGVGWRTLAGFGWLLPKRFRDAAYSVLVRHRYQWFGKREQCMLPSPEERARFVPEPASADD